MSRKGYLLATASGVAAAAAGSAHAADMGLPAKAPVPLPPPAVWAGWYIGVNAGTHWQLATNQNGYAGGSSASTGVTDTKSGFIGGGQIGYNWQSGNFVYGLEGDFDGLTGTASTTNFGSPNGKFFTNKIRWLSTLRTRTGLALGETMVYMTGGLAIGGVKNSWNAPPSFDPKSVSQTRVGWTAGGGIEHMLTPNWVIGTEVLFVDLGHSTANSTTNLNGNHIATFSNQDVISRLRLSYKW
jgi:outer membrane immunogenic protein